MENRFFASDAFFEVLRDVYFPGATIRYVACENVIARALVRGGKPISGFWNYPFPLIPVEPPFEVPVMSVSHFAEVVRGVTKAGEPGPPGTRPSPFIRWSDFDSWNAYERFATEELGARASSLERDQKRLAQALGPVVFVPNDPDPEAFDATIRWKAAHYQRSGAGNRYYIEQNIEFYREMRKRGLLMISTLRAGGRIVAAQFSNHWEGAFLYRLTSYDHDLRTFSPGAIHLSYLLRYSYESGDSEFDFLYGSEAYKYNYATHVRWIGSVGREPRVQKWRRRGRMHAGRAVSRFPVVHRNLRIAESTATKLLRRLRAR